MAKLYPPGLNGTLPAFTNLSEIKIPFTPNKTVGNNSNFISGFSLILKNVTNNTVVATVQSSSFDFIKNEVVFDCGSQIKNNFKIGRFYKAQLAYINTENEVGFYSTVGVIKYTAMPQLSINSLEQGYYNQALLKYTGVYSNEKDATEKVYSYSFSIKDVMGNVFVETKELIHNHSFDTSLNESVDEFICEKEMELNKVYYITYSVKTSNGLKASSPAYPIKMIETEMYQGKLVLNINLDEENAYMSVVLQNKTGAAVTGSFSITRACSKDNYAIWNEIYRIGFDSDNFDSKEILKDFTIEHGYGYRYGIQQYNKYGYYTERDKTDEIFAKFEHIYLFDGQRQLKIKYNPKINSMKVIKQESKTETIGSKYPYFFRNGKVSYKELPVGGLISYLSDEQELFLTDEELFKETFQTIKNEPFDWFNQEYDKKLENSHRETGLTDGNVKAEKVFRDEVLSFLTDGKYKIFKSPTEGNMIVYTMNTSLSPNTTVGRMIWDFNSTIYECMDYTYENLCNYDFLTWEIPLTGNDKMKTIMTDYLYEFYQEEKNKQNSSLITDINNDKYFDISYGYDIYSVFIHNASPGTKYYIDGHEIIIGVSGQYSVDFGRRISSLKVVPSKSSGYVTFRYKQETFNPFNIVHGLYVEKLPIFKQIIGKRHITEELDNPLDIFEDFNYIKFSRRNVHTLYVKLEDLAYSEEQYNVSYNLEKIFKNDKEQHFYQDIHCIREFNNFLHSVIYEIRAVKINSVINKPESKLVFYLSYDEKAYPRIDYYYETLTESSKWSNYKDREIKIKWDWANSWNLWDGKEVIKFAQQKEYDRYILNPSYEKVALIPYKETYEQAYYEPLGKLSENDFNNIICYELNGEKYQKAEFYDLTKEYYQKHSYLIRSAIENEYIESYNIFYKASDYNDYYLKKIDNKIFIAPCQYDCKVFLRGVFSNQKEDTTEQEIKTSVIDVNKDIVFKVPDVSDIETLNTGWGVICEFMYSEKRRLYGFENYNSINVSKNPNDAENYINYVNRLSDLLYFYSIGDSIDNGVEGDNTI